MSVHSASARATLRTGWTTDSSRSRLSGRLAALGRSPSSLESVIGGLLSRLRIARSRTAGLDVAQHAPHERRAAQHHPGVAGQGPEELKAEDSLARRPRL